MDKWEYKEVHQELGDKLNSDEKLPWKPFLRQVFVCSGVWICIFLNGLSTGAPTVFIPQIRREANSTAAVSTEMASWLSAIFGFGSLPWIIVLVIIMRYFGRVLPYRLLSVVTLTAYIVFCFSTNVTHILISEIMQSIMSAAILTLFNIILSEYTTPQYRGVFLTIKCAFYYCGIWLSNAIGTFFYWKNIGILQVACSIYVILTGIYLPESPYWLASKQRIQNCISAHHWLKGYTKDGDLELESIINTQNNTSGSQNSIAKRRKLDILHDIITCKELYKPIIFCMLLSNLYYSTGKLVCTVYAIDVIKKISSSESVAYTIMLILDGLTVMGMFIGCGVSKLLKRKTLLVACTSIGVAFLYTMSLYLYLVKLDVISENKYVTACFLMCYSLGISCGPMILCTSVMSELLPIKFRNCVVFITCMYDITVYGIFLKVAPTVFIVFEIHGAFLIFGILSSIFLILVYIYLPETKDKSLQEIARLMVDEDKNNRLEQNIVLVNNNNIKNVLKK